MHALPCTHADMHASRTLAGLSTQLDSSTEDGRQKPKIEVVLVKAPTFDAVVEQQAKEQAAKQAAALPAETA